MLNKVLLVGKIATDPELRYFRNGNIITVINLMTNENINGINQNYWHRVIINKKNKQLKKDMIIALTGKIRTRKWLDNKNKYNYITEIIAEEVKIINNNLVNEKYEEEIEYNEENNINNEEYEKEDNNEKKIKGYEEENEKEYYDDEDEKNYI